MNPSNFKGALLEYLVRRLLANCGFIPVIADDFYTYESGDLFYINGRGAAHDADVLMEPPVQLPFTFPSRVLFECKAYDRIAGLPIVRNALGLRYDINEFEIVTKESIDNRRNNRRANYAIEERKRYNYQVGVASAGRFSSPAIEFAANNKIPLLSLTWFLEQNILNLFHSIDQAYVDQINENNRIEIYRFLKDRSVGSDLYVNDDDTRAYLEEDQTIGVIITAFNSLIERSYVGLIETGDLIFLFPERPESINDLRTIDAIGGLKGQIHYYREEPNIWTLSISRDYASNRIAEFKFFVPDRIMKLWGRHALDRAKAIDIKKEFFSRIFIFNRRHIPYVPFFLVNIDSEWLDNIYGASNFI